MNGHHAARRRWGVWGAGPRIVMVTVAVYLLIVVSAAAVPVLHVGGARPFRSSALAWLLIVGAVVAWFLVIRRVRTAYNLGRLDTSGVFA
jgi:type VI protein secretion system component VasK